MRLKCRGRRSSTWPCRNARRSGLDPAAAHWNRTLAALRGPYVLVSDLGRPIITSMFHATSSLYVQTTETGKHLKNSLDTIPIAPGPGIWMSYHPGSGAMLKMSCRSHFKGWNKGPSYRPLDSRAFFIRTNNIKDPQYFSICLLLLISWGPKPEKP